MIKIITGKHDSGKTSYLRYLVKDSKFFNGFLEYKKYDEEDNFIGYELYSIEEDQTFDIIKTESEESFEKGKYEIIEEGLNKGREIISDAIGKDKILVIDQIGPLEMKKKLFHNQIIEALKSGIEIYITVEEKLLNDFIEKYKVRDYKLIRIGK